MTDVASINVQGLNSDLKEWIQLNLQESGSVFRLTLLSRENEREESCDAFFSCRLLIFTHAKCRLKLSVEPENDSIIEMQLNIVCKVKVFPLFLYSSYLLERIHTLAHSK